MRRNDLILCVIFLALVCACAWLLWGAGPEPVVVTPTGVATSGTATATAWPTFTSTVRPSSTLAPTCTSTATARPTIVPSETPVPTATRRPVATTRPTHEPYERRETPVWVRAPGVMQAQPDCLCLVDGRFVWCECQ